ncbi:phage terminase large subunit family protein [Pseudophaeobacter leonis]|uniref:phage terminase large subunit family protein n=1 Tax=Pseudophaeobacter leonis TaxID=1144477 RepID=UPI001F4E2558|nr:phage terminase large subunit family protein [Pseudophaeobacter leonis]
MKSYPGGFLMFSWSGSPKTMRGRSAPFIVCDETDGYDRTSEGHPVGLLWQRAGNGVCRPGADGRGGRDGGHRHAERPARG